ncbi:hypothetical protein [Kutzneria buriramensis]|uniref:D-alanyl-D-alanine carboxypeptidase-like protein n=1 Tax=Kutzneria buriramensis TaxID=1045776 RepID=A0A3E0G5V6_9PSEU|nr:hypothetical protein [Kutzneria buriramensis]REH17984.1 hypothetical protein BCF44_13916 [Kutzneria buriramensis]
MNEKSAVSRRRLFKGGLVVVGAGALLSTRTVTKAVAADAQAAWKSNTTANGWPVVGPPAPTRVEGTGFALSVLPGAVATVLLHCVRRYYYEVDHTLVQTDILGYVSDPRVAAAFESNHLSGTAVAVRPGWYPIGVAGGFLAREVVVIRDILADCEGVVRWGGDLNPLKESHFQIDVGPNDAKLRQVAAKIEQWRSRPGRGAGSAVDPFSSERRAAARSLAAMQRH